MSTGDRTEAVLTAVAQAMVGEGDDLVVDLAKLEDGLAAAGINCTATTNRGALATELSFLRDELRTQRVRFEHADPEGREEIHPLIERMEAREDEIQGLLWR